ncbi:hypothetical protein QJS10_CPA09g01980 [Acorus calamus]|uniref:DUF7906 domain-containing protein n=1 Tax=Acorus calamus TaxID=4465 RepID=A0AAV9E7P5_ACOCL|nr:hypothetical protein QJS10_CPA09g01980 [Acorus calamus]
MYWFFYIGHARMDPRNKDVDLDSLMYEKINGLTDKELSAQEANYIYRYRYHGGGASQVWLSSGRFVVIDLSAGPCTYGKIETKEGSVNQEAAPPHGMDALFAGMKEQRTKCSCRASKCKC